MARKTHNEWNKHDERNNAEEFGGPSSGGHYTLTLNRRPTEVGRWEEVTYFISNNFKILLHNLIGLKKKLDKQFVQLLEQN